MVNVVWLDTNECSMSTWQSKEELLDSKFCTVDSLGYLIADKDDIYGRAQVIPKGVVLDIQFLSKNEDNN